MMRVIEENNKDRLLYEKFHKDDKEEFRKQTVSFKNEIMRGHDFQYKNLKKDPPLNEGKYRIKYETIKP